MLLAAFFSGESPERDSPEKRLFIYFGWWRHQPIRKIIQTRTDVKEVLNLDQAAEYVSLSKSAIYKKTAERNIPHFKKGKKLYFKRSELDDWLTSVKVTTNDEIEREAVNYILKRRKKRL